MGVTDETGHSRRVAHSAPRLVGEVHANEDVTGDPNAADDLLLRVLDLGHLFHRNLDLEDIVLHVEALDAVLEVGLHAVLVAGVRVDDEPVAWLGLQLAAERLDRVLVLVRLVVGLRSRLVGRLSDDHSIGGVDGSIDIAVHRDVFGCSNVRICTLGVGHDGVDDLFRRLDRLLRHG